MGGFADRARSRLPAARSPSTAEFKEVMDYVEFVINVCDQNMAKVAPEYAGNWYYILVGALNVTIALREGKLTKGPVYARYGLARRSVNLAYADHYLQMRGDAFNLGPAGKMELQQAVFNYDVAKVMRIVPQTGSEPVSPATQLSVFWGLRGIEDGLKDDQSYPRASGSPRYAGNAAYERVTFALTKAGIIAASALERIGHAYGPGVGDSWRR